MAENKTKPGKENVKSFLNQIKDDKKKEDCVKILELMEKATRQKPVIWGGSMIGFGSYHYKYESGREGDCFPVGFSPRAQNITLYVPFFGKYPENINKLGKFKAGKSCVYIKKLEDIDTKVLKTLIVDSLKNIKKLYPDK